MFCFLFPATFSSYSDSLDIKLPRTPQDSTLTPTKHRSPHASFKLPVAHAELPEKPKLNHQPAIPVPKLVSRPRPHGPQLSLDLDRMATVKKVSVLYTDLPKASRSNRSSPLENSWWTASGAPVKPRLAHAKSLDDLLIGNTPVLVELTQNKQSKYSRLVIMASTHTLTEDVPEPDKEEPALIEEPSTLNEEPSALNKEPALIRQAALNEDPQPSTQFVPTGSLFIANS